MSTQIEVNGSVTHWISLFTAYRVSTVRDEEVVQGLLPPGSDPQNPSVQAILERSGRIRYVRDTPDGAEVTLVRRLAPRPRERWWLHALLFLLALVTTTLAGAMLVLGRDPIIARWLPLGSFAVPAPVGLVSSGVLPGLTFSLPLLGILFGHEMGHYLVARRAGMDVSPPYFIPAPHWINLIGTFGAFIRVRSTMINRALLLDVGAGGPVVSFVLSVPVMLLGLALSQEVPAPPGGATARFAVMFDGQPIWLGASLIGRLLAFVAGDGNGVILLHPLAFAGWLGFFVTALNLFPLAQLDGGHILYALLRDRQRWVGLGFLGLLLVLGNPAWGGWFGWWFWAAMILLIGRGRIRHPPVFDPEFPVTGGRRVLGWLCVLMFVLTFVPIPIRI